MNKNNTTRKKPQVKTKAKAQRAVSRAVKEVGFKNIKEVKDTLKAAQTNLYASEPASCKVNANAPLKGCCPDSDKKGYSSQINYTFSIPNTEEYAYIREEQASLVEDPCASKTYIQERINYLLKKHSTLTSTQQTVEESILALLGSVFSLSSVGDKKSYPGAVTLRIVKG